MEILMIFKKRKAKKNEKHILQKKVEPDICTY